MHWIDWLIVAASIVVVLGIAFRARRYVRDVSDFLAAGRVAGRYVLCVASGAAGFGLIGLVGNLEMYYKSGFAIGFWEQLLFPITIVMLLTGFCYYRYRETRALTMGQFFEIRYSKSFRIFAGILQSISGVINYAIFPAIGARCLIYFCELPIEVTLYQMQFPTFGLVMAGFLALAVFIVCLGGQVTIMTTDCVQGLLAYPFSMVIVGYILTQFSWSSEMVPALFDRAPGTSMLDPFDVAKLRDFNLFYVLVGVFGSIATTMSWQGYAGYNAAAISPHEQKMGAVLGGWRGGFSWMMYIFLAVAAYTLLNSNNADLRKDALDVRRELAVKVLDDIVKEDHFSDFRRDSVHFLSTGEINTSMQARLDKATADEQAETARIEELNEERYALDPESRPAAPVDADIVEEPQRPDREASFHTVYKALKGEENDGKRKAQTFQTIYTQMRAPVALKQLFPVGITGVFCAIMIFLLISTDTSYIHSWGSIIVQDLVLPFRKKPFTPKQQLNLLRLVIASVAVFAFLFSFLYKQNDYILMFLAITGAIWLGGAGPCILFGLYWKRGTATAAFAALISGSSLSVASILARANWVDKIYPWLLDTGHITWVRGFLEGVSRPFNPIIVWKVTGDMYPINSREVWFIVMMISFGLYIGISLLSRHKPFNMERMLHRGKYHVEGKAIERPKWTFVRILGIDAQYTNGDKVLAWSVFLWSVLYSFGTCLVIVIWNAIYAWPRAWWGNWFYVNYIVVYAVIAIITTFWFTIGTTLDLSRMFRRLAAKDANVRDDGRVIGHVSSADVELIEKIEHRHITGDSEDQEGVQ